MSELPPHGSPRLPAPTTPAGTPAVSAGTVEPSDAAGDSIDLKESLAVLRRHIRLIALVTIATVGVTAYRVHRQRLQYEATAVIRLVDARRQLAGNLDNSAPTAPLTGAWTDPLQSQLQVLRSCQ